MGGMTRTYELMAIVRPDIEVTERRAEDIVKKIVEKVSGTLVSVTVWGKRQLAYPIQKATEGTYLLATIEGEGIKSGDLEKEVRMGSDILRFMLTVK